MKFKLIEMQENKASNHLDSIRVSRSVIAASLGLINQTGVGFFWDGGLKETVPAVTQHSSAAARQSRGG